MKFEEILKDVMGKAKSEDPGVLASKVKYLEKLNGALLTFLVRRGIMSRKDALKMVEEARKL